MRHKRRLWVILLIGVAAFACGPAIDTSQPPDIRFGEDICDECNMIISEPRFAAAYYTPDGQARRFDDIGDMCAYHAAHQERVASFWVHDYLTEEWLPAEEATFVLASDLYTPMAHGVVAFADRAEAEGFSAEVSGQLMSFQAVLDHYAAEGVGADAHRADGLDDSMDSGHSGGG